MSFGRFAFAFFRFRVLVFALANVVENLLAVRIHSERFAGILDLKIFAEIFQSVFAFAKIRLEFLSRLLFAQGAVASTVEPLRVTGVFLFERKASSIENEFFSSTNFEFLKFGE